MVVLTCQRKLYLVSPIRDILYAVPDFFRITSSIFRNDTIAKRNSDRKLATEKFA